MSIESFHGKNRSMVSNLDELPQEILNQILLYLPPLSVLSFEQVCHKFQDLCGSLVWRQLCEVNFKYWSPQHEITKKLARPVDKTDWKHLFSIRFKKDLEVKCAIDNFLAHQHDRTSKIEGIVKLGWDTKDTLLQQCHAGDERDDVLARRWYGGVILGCLHRSIAIERWTQLGSPAENVVLEQALAAFDLFVTQEGNGNLEDVPTMLDSIACKFSNDTPEFAEFSLREKATVIAEYVRKHHLVGIDGNVDAHYHDLQNSFIGNALSHEHHQSLPLISVAIYCSLAQRLGLDARPCGFPFHVFAIIRSPNHETIYLDPFRTQEETKLANLTSQLVSMGAHQDQHARLLGVAPTADIIARCARNIITSIQMLPRDDVDVSGTLNPDNAFYAALWVLLLTSSAQGERASMMQQAAYLPVIINHMSAQFPSDVWLMEKYLTPSFETVQQGTADTLRSIRLNADALKPLKARAAAIDKQVSYRVGQVFRHRRYQYHAVIIGWDTECAASEQWMSQMRVHELPDGKHQSFYHVLVEDKSVRYVAQENIEIVRKEPFTSLLEIAGQFFKRWDANTKTFVSNICDEYPDD